MPLNLTLEIHKPDGNTVNNQVSNIFKDTEVFSKATVEDSDQSGSNNVIIIVIVSLLFVSFTIICAVTAYYWKKKGRSIVGCCQNTICCQKLNFCFTKLSCCCPIVLSRCFRCKQGKIFPSKTPFDKVELVNESSRESSVYDHIGPIKPDGFTFYDIDLEEDQPKPKENDKTQNLDADKMGSFRSIRILTALYNQSKPKEEKRPDWDVVYPMSLENENYDLNGEDFKPGAVEKVVNKNYGTIKTQSDYDPSKEINCSTPGLLMVKAGEELTIIRKDLGTGFTFVQNQGNKSGFVPTNILSHHG